MKKRFGIKLLEFYDKNYGMTLFEEKDFEKIVDEFISKDDKISDEVCQVILNDLSAKKGGRLLKVNDSRKKLIKSVFSQGYEIDDFIEVNSCLVKKWLTDSSMKDNLTPETLYSGKFTKYRELADQQDFEPAIQRIRNTTEEALREIRNEDNK